MRMVLKRKLSVGLCVLLILCTVLGAVLQKGMEVRAAEENEWEIDEDGVLMQYNGSGGNVTIPKRVTSIGRSAFSGCSGLTSITIPKSVTSIEDFVFNDCSGLTSISIPESVMSIRGYAFSGCSGLKNITLPKKMTDIWGYAFADCSSLTNITIPSGLKYIGEGVFSGCSSLGSISIPEGVTYVGWGAFYKCSGLKTITFPKSMTSIEPYAFSGCSSLRNVSIPKKVTGIGDSAFADCSSLSSITIPESATNIGGRVFFGCSKKLTIYGKAGSYIETYAKENGIKFSADTELQSGEQKNLTDKNVTLSQTSYAYNGKARKPSVTVKDGKKVLKAEKDYIVSYKNNKNAGKAKVIVTGKGNYKGTVTKTFTIKVKKNTSHEVGFYQYKVTGSSTVSVTTLKDSKVTKVKIPQKVKIGGKNFKVTAVGNNAFKKNRKITEVEIGNNVKVIGAGAFESCTKLSKVNVGKGVTEIGKNAFKNCKKLKNITIKSTNLKKVGKNALKGIKFNAEIKVPAKKLSEYQKLFQNKGQGRKVKIVK